MNYFLGFIPNQEANYKIRKVVGDLGRVFDGQDVNVRWNKPETFSISLLNLGRSLNFLKREYLLYKLRRLGLKSFEVQLEKASVGISRSYKELIYLTLGKGGDNIRTMLFNLRGIVRSSQNSIFIPHITLGRISKDLSNEEYSNLILDVRNTNKQLKIDEIAFRVDTICLIQVDDEGSHKIVKSLALQ